MIGFWTPLFAFISRFFTVWANSLLETLPEGIQEHLLLSRLPVNVSATEFVDDTHKTMVAGAPFTINVDESKSLHYQFAIPACAGSELTRAVALEAERILPLNITNLATAFRPVLEQSTDELIMIDLVAVKKKLIDEILRKSERIGASLKAIQVPIKDGDSSIEIPVANVSLKRKLTTTTVAFLAIIIVVVSLQLPSIYATRLSSEVDAVDRKINIARSATRQVATLQSEVREKRDLSGAISRMKRSLRVTALMEALTIASPDHVVLETFRLDGDRLSITGVAVDPEEWAIELEKEDTFHDVVLTSVRDYDGAQLQRFEMRLNVAWESLWEQAQ